MLMPFDFVILTYDEAVTLCEFVKKNILVPKGTKPSPAKDIKDGVAALYSKLTEFITMSNHYQNDLRSLDPGDFVTHGELR